jgi:DNA-binding NtrC family response regulator
MGKRPDRPYNSPTTPMEHRHTVVVVDEHEDSCFMLVEALKVDDLDADGFTEPGPAFERLKRPPAPCMLIVDYRIGHREGDDFIREARATNPNVPIGVCTVASPDAAALRRLGVVEVLEMPRQMAKMVDMVMRHRWRPMPVGGARDGP